MRQASKIFGVKQADGNLRRVPDSKSFDRLESTNELQYLMSSDKDEGLTASLPKVASVQPEASPRDHPQTRLCSSPPPDPPLVPVARCSVDH